MSFTRVTMFIPGRRSLEMAGPAALAGLPSAPEIEGPEIEGPEIEGPEIEWIENDGQFGAAFSFGTVPPAGVAEIAAAPGALVLSWPIDLRTGRHTIVAAIERLRDAGALAVRLEQSKVGWAIDRWLELFGSNDPWAWYRGAVAMLGSEDTIQSCGMHAFSLPDVRAEIDDDRDDLAELAAVLSVYQLAEDPVIRSGQTFTPDGRTPRRVVERWPDDAYAPTHPCHNPYGVWRSARPAGRHARCRSSTSRSCRRWSRS